VYVAVRQLSGEFKVSLHASGDWRYAFTQERLAKSRAPLLAEFGGRVIDRWSRPPWEPPGQVRALSIVVPTSDLRRPPRSEPLDPKVDWIIAPSRGLIVRFDLFIGAPHLTFPDWPGTSSDGTQVIEPIRCPDGRTAWIFVEMHQPTPELKKGLAAHHRLIRTLLACSAEAQHALLQESPSGSGRMIFHGPDETGIAGCMTWPCLEL
jgi:hypothetical protein